jgi:hypothetical protein
VIGGDGIDHIDVGTGGLHQVNGTADDTGDVLQIVGTVKLGVLGEYLGLDELHQIKAGGVADHKKLAYLLQNYEIFLTFASK